MAWGFFLDGFESNCGNATTPMTHDAWVGFQLLSDVFVLQTLGCQQHNYARCTNLASTFLDRDHFSKVA